MIFPPYISTNIIVPNSFLLLNHEYKTYCIQISLVVLNDLTDYSGRIVSGKAIKQNRAKYKQLRKKLQQRQTPSARRRLKAVGQRENRWMQDVNHQVSKALVENYPKHTLFVLEDLAGVRSVAEKVRRKDRYVSVSWPFYDLEQKLKAGVVYP